MISMNTIPSNIRVPLAYVEFNNTRAQAISQSYRVVLLGQKLAAGIATAGELVRVPGADSAEELFGRGSMLAAMFTMFKKANRYTETWAIALDDDVAGTAATGTLTIAGAPTAAGTLNVYLAGTRIRIGITTTDTATTIAAALVVAINADTSLPISAAANATPEQVDLTARHKGECGNDLDVRVNYYDDERTPAGVTATVAALSGGAGNPDIAAAITAIGEEQFHGFVMPYTDSANLMLLETELADRWAGVRQNDGVAYAAYRASYSAAADFGAGRNSNLITCMDTNISPSPTYEWAAVYAAVASASLSIDPARPLQTLALPNIKPAAISLGRNLAERNLLLFDGISTNTVDAGGNVLIERAITMYQENAFGVADASYLDLNTPATLSYLRWSLRQRITQRFPRYKLASDGTNYGAGQAIVTPRTIRDELIALAKEWELKGLVENIEQYKTELLVERNLDDKNRVDVLAPPDLVNQFRIFAAQLQYIV